MGLPADMAALKKELKMADGKGGSGGNGKGGGGPSQSDLDNRSDQLNPNNDAYHQSRGLPERPEDWDEED